jgi:peroxiredoxin
MRTLAALAILIVAPQQQEGDVIKIMRRFVDRRTAVKSADEFKTLVLATRDELDAYVKKSVATDPERARAAFHAGEMHLFLNEVEGAYGRFEEFVKSYPDNQDFIHLARFLLGDLALQLGRDSVAREKFADFVRTAPKDDTRLFGAKLLSALSFVNEANYDDAVKALTVLRDGAGATQQGWAAGVQLALTYHLMEKGDEAKRALEIVIRGCTDLEMSERSKQLLTDWLSVGTPIAAFEGKDVTGGDFKRAEGRVTLLYFFTTTFEQASAEAAMMKRLATQFGPKGLAVMGISIDKKAEEVQKFAKDNQVTWPVCCDGDGYDGPIAKKLRVRSLPFVVLVDKKGVARFLNVIYTPGAREILPAIEKLLGEK